jgi:hypothetical protein
MKVLQIGSIIVAITITAAFPIGKNPSAEPNVAAEAEANPETPKSLAPSVETNHSSGNESSALSEKKRSVIRQKRHTQNQRITRLIQRGTRQACPIYLFILMANFHLQESRRTLCWSL